LVVKASGPILLSLANASKGNLDCQWWRLASWLRRPEQFPSPPDEEDFVCECLGLQRPTVKTWACWHGFGALAGQGAAIARNTVPAATPLPEWEQAPTDLAPPFRDLSKSYPIETHEKALAESIVVGHPGMPRFTFKPTRSMLYW